MNQIFTEFRDVSPDFKACKKDRQTIKKILPYWETPEAIKVFARYAYRFSDYAYWYVLSTLWVSYAGWSDLDEWKRLFSSKRAGRDSGIMKPSELNIFNAIGEDLVLYRAHRQGEADWISYSLSPTTAGKFAAKRVVDRISAYKVMKSDALCIFLRRGEFEVIVLDKRNAEFIEDIPVVVTDE